MAYILQAINLLKLHEGFRSKPYKDSLGIVTIGYGRNLESRGLTEPEAAYLLGCDVKEAEEYLHKGYDYYYTLSGQRKAVLLDMMVNLGPTRLRGFRKMHQALAGRDYELASLEMLDSKWARQVGNRAITLSKIMQSNKL